MENKILNWTLKIIIHTSALLSVWRSKNKFWHMCCLYMVNVKKEQEKDEKRYWVYLYH